MNNTNNSAKNPAQGPNSIRKANSKAKLQRGPQHPTLLRSGNGKSKSTAKWSVDLAANQSGLPGYVVDTMHTSSVRYIRVTASEARYWSQLCTKVYNGNTLWLTDLDQLRKAPMPKPSSPRENSGKAAVVVEEVDRIVEQIKSEDDIGYQQMMAFQECLNQTGEGDHGTKRGE
ncbi:hypothetical protein NX059_006477 [Plenodomus lindquistii]|nr:hypothetical protein NX059_006477 [Plenodomus lindquistii]